MLLTFVCLFATAAAAPALVYDQRQDGKYNNQADISNVLVLVAIPSKLPAALFDLFSRSDKHINEDHDGIQDRADVRVTEAFVKPNKPYQVEIGSVEKIDSAGEVVIAGRRRLGNDLPDAEQDELKLLGATENCGPDRVRDSVTLMCKDKEPAKLDSEPEPQKQTEEKVPALETQPAPEVIAS